MRARKTLSLLLYSSSVLKSFFFLSLNLLCTVECFGFPPADFIYFLDTTSAFSLLALSLAFLAFSLLALSQARTHSRLSLAPQVLQGTVDFDKKTNEAISEADVEE